MSKSIMFVSDLGLRDEFVGVCHMVIARIAPEAHVIDLTHGVAPHDVRAGALILAECMRYSPADAIGLGIIDPGVGTARRPIAVETESGHLLVGPDNGLLSLAWQVDGGPRRAVAIVSPEVIIEPVSNVFHGRDVFAPAAAHLALGVDLDVLGPQLAVDELTAVKIAEPGIERGRVEAEVLDVDRFGNVRLNVRGAHLSAAGLDETSALEISTTAKVIRAERIRSYGQVAPGAYGALLDAWEWLAVIRYEASAAADLQVLAGDPVWLTAA